MEPHNISVSGYRLENSSADLADDNSSENWNLDDDDAINNYIIITYKDAKSVILCSLEKLEHQKTR